MNVMRNLGGLFMTPTLRNVALRQSFFIMASCIRCTTWLTPHAERAVAPRKWYPSSSDDGVRKFDDLPVIYHDNINGEPPFNRHVGDTPPLSVQGIKDVVSFLQALTDGYERAGVINPLPRHKITLMKCRFVSRA